MNVRIRIASPADAPSVNAVYAHYIAHTDVNFNEQNKSDEARAEEIALLLHDYPFLIAEDEDARFLGFACAEPIRPQSGYRYCVELTIYLHPDVPKHTGVGTHLYQALLELLTQQGYCRAFGVIYAENLQSLAFHRRFGFTEAFRMEKVGFKNGRWLDVVVMQKELAPCIPAPALPVPFETFRKTLST